MSAPTPAEVALRNALSRPVAVEEGDGTVIMHCRTPEEARALFLALGGMLAEIRRVG